MEIDKVVLTYFVPRRSLVPRSDSQNTILSQELSQLVETRTIQQVFFFREVKSCWVYILFLVQPGTDLSSHNSHQVFIISSLYTADIKLYHRRTADMRRVGGEQLRPHYQTTIRTVCIVYTLQHWGRWQHNTTGPSELRLVLVIVLVRQTGGDQARRSEIWKACYHHHHSTIYRQTQILP